MGCLICMYVCIHIYVQGLSKKKLNFLNRAPLNQHNWCTAVTLNISLPFAQSCRVIKYIMQSECVFCAFYIFLAVEIWKILKSKVCEINKIFLPQLFKCFSRVMDRLFKSLAVLQMASTFQMSQNVHWRQFHNWIAFCVNIQWSGSESAWIYETCHLDDHKVSEDTDMIKSSCRTILAAKLELLHVAANLCRISW